MADAIAALGPDDTERLRRLLQSFVMEAEARCALLLNRNGLAVAAVGDTRGLDQTTFASLAAADFDASDQLAGLLGEREFTSLYHQGVHGSMYLSEIAGVAILAAVFDQRTTLGLVRLKTREVVPRITRVLQELDARPTQGERLSADWTDDAVDEIDRLFAGE